jgi:hypothetical protein
MKNMVLTFLSLICLTALLADIGSFQGLGNCIFAGKPAVYASGDTLAIVVKTSTFAEMYQISTDNGQNWLTHTLSNNCTGYSAPTLAYSPTTCYVTGKRNISHSPNGGLVWDSPPITWEGSFDNTPIIEKYNNSYRMFVNRMPYPEDRQREFAISGTDDFRTPQLMFDKQQAQTGENVYFNGGDVLYGPVYINDDIHIRQMGGGTNNGWPIFFGPVIVAGEVMSNPGNYPTDQVFRGGLVTNAPKTRFPNPNEFRSHGQRVGPASYDPNRIVIVVVNGNQFGGMVGQIQPPRNVFADVWDNYPDNISQPPLYQNSFTVRDTIWTILPMGSSVNRASFVNSDLWIKGNFSGYQTWYAAGDIKIIGDITLTNTTPGSQPPPTDPSDVVNLVADKNILLKYGYKNPEDLLRVHPLCRADSEPINIYANLMALGDMSGDEFQEGIFSFEYQHPHGSIPATLIDVPNTGSTLFDWIDLHRNYWPQTAENPWPSWLDYPWYNPLWPEAHPYLERGTVQHWGSLFQRRYGYLHRTLTDLQNPEGIWNPALDLGGGPSGTTATNITLYQDPPVVANLQAMNYPGTTGTGIGYKRNFYPGSFTTLRNSLSNSVYTDCMQGTWGFGISLDGLEFTGTEAILRPWCQKPQVQVSYGKSYAKRDNYSAYSVNDLLLHMNGYYLTDLSDITSGNGIINTIALDADYNPWVYQSQTTDGQTVANISHISATTQEVLHSVSIPTFNKTNDIAVMPNGRVLFAKYNQETFNEIGLWDITNGEQPVYLETWPLTADETSFLPTPNPNTRLYLIPSGESTLQVFLWYPHYSPSPEQYANGFGELFKATAALSVSVEDNLIPEALNVGFSAYPNPMRADLTLKLDVSKHCQTDLQIYNLKGQRIKVLQVNSETGNAECYWDGTDNSGIRAASGIYFIRLKVNNKVVASKRICKI